MGSMQIVFLFDLSTCKDVIFKPREELNKILLAIRLACLRLLTECSTKTCNLRWGFKFFDSYGSMTQNMCTFSFSDVSLENFETLESEICIQFERHLSCLEALAETSQDTPNQVKEKDDNSNVEKHTNAPVKILQQALTQVLYEFQWENVDMWSPSIKKLKDKSFGRKNFLFLISDFKDNDEALFQYFGLKSLPAKSKFCNIIIPQALQKHLSEKAYIHWVWLNVSQDQSFLGTSSSKVLPLLSYALHSIQGCLIPLHLLSQSTYHTKYIKCSEKFSSGKEIPLVSDSSSSFNNSLLPFSSLFQQCLIQPFYSNVSNPSNKCNFIFANTNTVIPVQVLKISDKNLLKRSVKSTDTSIILSKCIIECATSKDVRYMAYGIFLCLPDEAAPGTTSAGNLKTLIKTMCGVKISLILTCETECGLRFTGMLTPLTDQVAVIEILDSLFHLMPKFSNKRTENQSLKCEKVSIENFLKDIQNFEMDSRNQCSTIETAQSLKPTSSKSFQIECLEPWYKSSSVCGVVSFMQSKLSSSRAKSDAFPKFLQHALKDYPGIKSPKEDGIQSSVQPDSVQQKEETEDMLTDLSEEALLSATKEIYNSALESSNKSDTCAKKILKRVSNFYKKHGSSSFEENVLNFMKSNFFLSARRISEKYAELQDATDQKLKECQIQIFLYLEIEALTLPPDKSDCINSVIALLRVMSFDYIDKSKLKIFFEVLRTSYSHSLHEVLGEIELGLFDFGEADSDDSPPDTLSSELNNESDIFSSVISSISEKSSSSVCSQPTANNRRRLVRHRSDISSSLRSRQVLLPRITPKKRKGKSSAQRKAVRCSPRLVTRNSHPQNQNKTEEEKPRNVRRNLFPKSNCSPKKGKTTATPKKTYSSKQKIVPETPCNKQNHSAFQRKKCRLKKHSSEDSPKEVAESPKIPNKAEGKVNKEFMKKLERRKSDPSLKPVSKSPIVKEPISFSFKQHTPESKRRLSLKLFSKILTSPTLRMGVKKCTKRLFDQVSPQKCSDSNKKHKPNDEPSLADLAQDTVSNITNHMKTS